MPHPDDEERLVHTVEKGRDTGQDTSDPGLARLAQEQGRRIAELHCLTAIQETLADDDTDDGEALDAVARIVPTGWRFPETTSARIRVHGTDHVSDGFAESPDRIGAEIPMKCGHGRVEVHVRSLETTRVGNETLEQTRSLLRRIGEQIGRSMDRRQVKRDLTAARDAAERASRAKTEFLSNMSHELRTPLNAILGFAQLIELDPTLNADNRTNIDEVLGAGRHLLDLINEILDLARIEAGRLDLSPESIDVATIIRDCVAIVRPLAEPTGVTLREAAPPAAWVRADRTRLKQALLNLLTNAVNYNKPGGRVDILVDTADSDRLTISVRDTGSGIPTDRLDDLFDAFTRLEPDRVEGSGIGLAITKRVVELMGGRVAVASVHGAGSTFSIALPRAKAPSAEASPSHDEQAAFRSLSPSSRGLRPRTILYIEDNVSNARLISSLLGRREDLRLLTARTARAGLRIAFTEAPDLILLDIGLPGEIDGYDALAALRRDPILRDVPVVAITALAMASDVDRGLEAGFTDYLTKPLNLDQFMDTVSRALSGRSH